MTSKRGEEWRSFAPIVEEHIEEYTVKQYGDKGSDLASDYTPKKCVEEMQKYLARHFTGVRGRDETMRDTLKICHYACMLYFKETEV